MPVQRFAVKLLLWQCLRSAEVCSGEFCAVPAVAAASKCCLKLSRLKENSFNQNNDTARQTHINNPDVYLACMLPAGAYQYQAVHASNSCTFDTDCRTNHRTIWAMIHIQGHFISYSDGHDTQRSAHGMLVRVGNVASCFDVPSCTKWSKASDKNKKCNTKYCIVAFRLSQGLLGDSADLFDGKTRC